MFKHFYIYYNISICFQILIVFTIYDDTMNTNLHAIRPLCVKIQKRIPYVVFTNYRMINGIVGPAGKLNEH